MNSNDRFIVAYEEHELTVTKTIYVDRATGVNYLYVSTGVSGAITPLLDADGKPVVTK